MTDDGDKNRESGIGLTENDKNKNNFACFGCSFVRAKERTKGQYNNQNS